MRQEEWERESVGVKKRPLTLTLSPKVGRGRNGFAPHDRLEPALQTRF